MLPKIVLFVLCFTLGLFELAVSAGQGLNTSDETAQQYLETFTKSGIPTSDAVSEAFQKARSSNTTEAWKIAASVANSYANIIDALSDHYAAVYRNDKRRENIQMAADYETVRNSYLEQRDQAYLALAAILYEKGEPAAALSYALTAIKLSSLKVNRTGEELIWKIVNAHNTP